jgi:hypothetical protein
MSDPAPILTERSAHACISCLVLRAREQGFDEHHCRTLSPGWTVLELGYAGEALPVVVLVIDENRIEAAGPDGLAYYRALSKEIGSAKTPSTAPAAVSWTTGDPIEALALKYVEAWKVGKLAEQLGEVLLEEMRERDLAAVNVAGAGAVTYHKAGVRKDVDRAATLAYIGEIVERLRSLGESVKGLDALPIKPVPRRAYLQVVPAVV